MEVNFPAVPHVPAIPMSYRVYYTVGNITLNTLNFVWFRACVQLPVLTPAALADAVCPQHDPRRAEALHYQARRQLQED